MADIDKSGRGSIGSKIVRCVLKQQLTVTGIILSMLHWYQWYMCRCNVCQLKVMLFPERVIVLSQPADKVIHKTGQCNCCYHRCRAPRNTMRISRVRGLHGTLELLHIMRHQTWNTFQNTGLCCVESISDRWIPYTKVSKALTWTSL